MRKFSPLFIAALVFTTFALACANTSDNKNVTVTPSDTNSASAAPSPNSSLEKGKEEKSFTFSAQGGKEIIGYVYPDDKKANGKMIIFSPFIDKTDGNLYNASLHSLWSVYGKKRGLFQLNDAKTKFDSDLGGNAICWQVFNPKQQFCVFPIKDSESDGIGVLRVWLQ